MTTITIIRKSLIITICQHLSTRPSNAKNKICLFNRDLFLIQSQFSRMLAKARLKLLELHKKQKVLVLSLDTSSGYSRHRIDLGSNKTVLKRLNSKCTMVVLDSRVATQLCNLAVSVNAYSFIVLPPTALHLGPVFLWERYCWHWFGNRWTMPIAWPLSSKEAQSWFQSVPIIFILRYVP